ncbi:MAG: ABC transporter permease subunit [Phycisphaerae bacterium]
MSVLTTIPWRLGPANPLLLRVVTAGGRRWRHAIIRWVYLGLLIGVLLIALLVASLQAGSLSELAKASTQVFAAISYVQLAMICLLAPVFTAGAITQERDSRTYSILLSTPLTNGQVVLGSLLSRLYYVVALLLSGVPVFAITLFYGGVTAQGILLSFSIALCTALFMGALAITIAVLRVGTTRTVLWFYVFIALYLVGLWVLDPALSGGAGGGGTGVREHTTALTGLHPFLALRAVVNPTDYAVPEASVLAGHSWLVRNYLAYPTQAYLVLTTTLSGLLVALGTMGVRRLAQQSQTNLWRRIWRNILQRLGVAGTTRPPRSVWKNPIAWREAVTRGSTLVRGLTRWLAIGLGIAATALIMWAYYTEILTTSQARQWLLGLILVEFSLTLLLAANTAAAAITREHEARNLDLFLVTPLTARDYVQGKLRGLLWFLLPLIVVPPGVLGVLTLGDLLTGRLADNPLVFPEVLLLLPIFTASFTILVCMLGLMSSLRWSKTITAVMATVATLAGLAGVLGFCGGVSMQIPIFGLIANALSPFTGLAVMLDPWHYASASFAEFNGAGGGGEATGLSTFAARIVLFISVLIVSGLYGLADWFMYRWLVRNFDLVLRRQHR